VENADEESETFESDDESKESDIDWMKYDNECMRKSNEDDSKNNVVKLTCMTKGFHLTEQTNNGETRWTCEGDYETGKRFAKSLGLPSPTKRMRHGDVECFEIKNYDNDDEKCEHQNVEKYWSDESSVENPTYEMSQMTVIRHIQVPTRPTYHHHISEETIRLALRNFGKVNGTI
jgi:hypothetical protein